MSAPRRRRNSAMRALMPLSLCLPLIGGMRQSRAPADPGALFTPSEIKTLLGVPVEAGSPSIAGCQWGHRGRRVLCSDRDHSRHELLRAARGCQGIPGAHGVGLYGWSGFEMGSWVASTNTGRFVLVTMVTSAKPDRGTLSCRRRKTREARPIDRAERPGPRDPAHAGGRSSREAPSVGACGRYRSLVVGVS